MWESVTRRTFIRQLGQGVVGVAVLGVAACGDGTAAVVSSVATTVSAGGPSGDGSSATDSGTSVASTVASTTPTTSTAGGDTSTRPPPETTSAPGPRIERIDLGFVSAYAVVSGSEAVVVDTGVGGSADQIEAALAALGIGWNAVGHVVVTHLHGDHQGSLGDVMTRASEAIGYAGAEDIPGISSPRTLTAVTDGDVVLGLEVISTPGHTAGHISLFEPTGRTLIAGDALNGGGSGAPGSDGGVGGPNPAFTADMLEGEASVAKLSALRPETIFFGHGRPLTEGAAEALAALVSS